MENGSGWATKNAWSPACRSFRNLDEMFAHLAATRPAEGLGGFPHPDEL